MAKINIKFNNVEYKIDDSALASAIANLVSYLSTEMSGSGETINLGGTSYNVDSTKLAAEKNDFISHLETIAGEGYKVTVGGVQFGVDSTKVANVIAELETVFDNLSNEGDEPDNPTIMRAAGLYETGTDNMVTSWDELIASGDIVVNDGAISLGRKLPDNLPEKNQYGFYYGVVYYDEYGNSYTFYENGSFVEFSYGEKYNYPAGSVTYSENNIYVAEYDWSLEIINDGKVMANDYILISIGQKFAIVGDLVLPNDNSVTIISDQVFINQSSLTDITIPDSVTYIGHSAFNGCSSLTNITIPNNVTFIGYDAFSGCSSLTSIIYNAINCGNIEVGTFSYTGQSETGISVIIGKDVDKIPNNLFETYYGSTSNIRSVVFETNSVCESIGDSAFKDCRSLTSVVIPDSVTSIGEWAFYNCSALQTVYYKGTESQWSAISISSGNTALTNATIHYNYQG